jgi:hypothetical protein
MNSKHNIYLTQIICDDKSYFLQFPLIVEVEYIDYDIILRNDYLNICVWGDTLPDAEDAFAFASKSMVEVYAEEDDSALTSGAIKIKKRLNDILGN